MQRVIFENMMVSLKVVLDQYESPLKLLSNLLCRLNYWGAHSVARVSSNVNKPPYATMVLVLVSIVCNRMRTPVIKSTQ
jgi:hypothetical protein